MAGNIIPAIATTNAITAGVVVLHALRVLQGEADKCLTVYTRLRLNPRNCLLVPEKVFTKPNPNCHVCSQKPAISIKIDTTKMRIKDFRDEVLIKTLNMINPEVVIVSIGAIVISSDEDETEENDDKFLKEMSIVDGVVLKADDFLQNYELSIIITHFDAKREDALFEVIGSNDQLQPDKEDDVSSKEDGIPQTNGAGGDGPSSSKKRRAQDEDDLELIEDDNYEIEGNVKVLPKIPIPANPYDDCITIADDDNDVEMKCAEAVENNASSVSETTKTSTAKRRPESESNDISSMDDGNSGPSDCKRTKTMTESDKTVETAVETVEIPKSVETVETVETEEIKKSVETVETVETEEIPKTVETEEILKIVETVETIKSVDAEDNK